MISDEALEMELLHGLAYRAFALGGGVDGAGEIGGRANCLVPYRQREHREHADHDDRAREHDDRGGERPASAHATLHAGDRWCKHDREESRDHDPDNDAQGDRDERDRGCCGDDDPDGGDDGAPRNIGPAVPARQIVRTGRGRGPEQLHHGSALLARSFTH